MRIEEHKEDVNSRPSLETRKLSGNIHNFAIANHMAMSNSIIDWEDVNIVDREGNKGRHAREVIWIRRTKGAINRVQGGHELSHFYNTVIHHPAQYCRSCLDKLMKVSAGKNYINSM